MTVPSVVGLGAANSGTTAAVTYALSAHQADDILLLFVECGQTTGVPTPPAGWAHVTNSPRAQGANVHAGNLMWKRATSAAETNPVVPAQANHQVGRTMVVRGCETTGDPWDIAAVNSNLSTTFSVVMGSTTVVDTLVVVGAGASADAATDQYPALLTNASVASITKQGFAASIDGNGGSVTIYTATKATAGSAGTFTATITSQQWSALAIALKPATAVNYPRDAADTTTLADTADRAISGPRSATDALTAADTAARSSNRSRAATDTVTATDTAARVRSAPRATTDAVTAGDVAARAPLALVRTCSEGITATDTAARASARARAAADTTTLVDVPTRAVTAVVARTTTETITTTDTAARTSTRARAAVDALTAADTAGRTSARARGATDTTTLVDTATRSASGRARTSVDAFTVTDTAAGQLAGAPLALVRTTADTITTTDTAARTSTRGRAAVDALAAADTGVRRVARPRQAVEVVSLADLAVTATHTARAALEVLQLVDGTVWSAAGSLVPVRVLQLAGRQRVVGTSASRGFVVVTGSRTRDPSGPARAFPVTIDDRPQRRP